MTGPQGGLPRLGEYLRDARLRAGISQRRLATMASVNPRYIRRLEAGDRVHPSPALMKCLADALEVDADTMLELIDRSHDTRDGDG